MDNNRIASQQTAHIISLGPAFDHSRVFCMSGQQAEFIANAYKGSRDPRPDVGEVCMLLLEHSADTQRDPAALRKYPDKALLAPFKRIAKDKGFRGTEEAATLILEALARVSGSPAAQESFGPGHLPLRGGGNGEPLVLVPGVAWDAGFTLTLREAQSGHTQPPPAKSRAELLSEASLCFSNVGRTIGACHADGVEHARDYLARQKVAAATR